MPIGTPGENDHDEDTTDGTSVTFKSMTPVSAAPTWVWVHTATTAGTVVSHVLTGSNGWNVTWTEKATYEVAVIGIANDRVTLFYGEPSSSTAGALTVTTTGQTQSVFAIKVLEITGTDINSLVATNTQNGNGTSTSAATGTMSSWNSGAIALSALIIGSTTATITWETSPGTWTNVGADFTGSSPSRKYSHAYATTQDLTPTAGISSSLPWLMIAVELKPAGGSSGAVGELANGEGGLASGAGLAGGAGILARSMEKFDVICPRSRAAGFALQGA